MCNCAAPHVYCSSLGNAICATPSRRSLIHCSTFRKSPNAGCAASEETCKTSILPSESYTLICLLVGALTAKRQSSVYKEIIAPYCQIMISYMSSSHSVSQCPQYFFLASLCYKSEASCASHRISTFYFPHPRRRCSLSHLSLAHRQTSQWISSWATNYTNPRQHSSGIPESGF
jgi:hypothetical protein